MTLQSLFTLSLKFGAARCHDSFRWSHKQRYTTVELDRPGAHCALPSPRAQRRLFAGSLLAQTQAAPAPRRRGARRPTTLPAETADGSTFGRVIHAKYVSAAPSALSPAGDSAIAGCRQWAPSRPGVTSAANHDELRSNTARCGSPQGGLGALGSGDPLHATQLCLGGVGSTFHLCRRRATGCSRRAR